MLTQIKYIILIIKLNKMKSNNQKYLTNEIIMIKINKKIKKSMYTDLYISAIKEFVEYLVKKLLFETGDIMQEEYQLQLQRFNQFQEEMLLIMLNS